jgi:predicted Zn finger-like uncharacterized protein
MLIACPACASEYEIEGVLVGAEGRSVRCAACGETWFVGPEKPEAAEDAGEIDPWDAAMLEDEPAAVPESAAPVIDQPVPSPRQPKPEPAKKRFALPTALPKPSPAIAMGVALFAALPIALFGRATVVRAMPQSAGVFAAVGLPVNLRGVDVRDVVAFRNPAEGSAPAQLIVEGDLVGVARDRVAVAPVEIEIRDAHDQSLYRWTVPPSRATLEAGESARFRASLSAPPIQGSQVIVRFADAGVSGEAVKTKPASANAGHGGH